jgi:hypothetical protein
MRLFSFLLFQQKGNAMFPLRPRRLCGEPLPHRYYGQIAHRDQARGCLSHAGDGIDGNDHRRDVAIRALELEIQVRLAGDLDGIPLVMPEPIFAWK